MNPTQRNIALGAVATLGVVALGYYLYAHVLKPDFDAPPEEATDAEEPKKKPLVERDEAASRAEAAPKAAETKEPPKPSKEEKEIELLAKQGIKLYQEGQYEAALSKFDEAFALCIDFCGYTDKTTVKVAHNRSAVLEKLNRLEDALLDCDLVLSAEPRHKKSRLRRSRLHYGASRLWDSLIDLTGAIMLVERELAAKMRQGRQPEQKDYPQLPDYMTSLTQNVLEQVTESLRERSDPPPPTDYEMHSILSTYDYYAALHDRLDAQLITNNKLNRSQQQKLRSDHVCEVKAVYDAVGKEDLPGKAAAAAKLMEAAIGCREYATAAETAAELEELLALGEDQVPGISAPEEEAQAAVARCLQRTPDLGRQDVIRLWLLVAVFRHMNSKYEAAKPAFSAALQKVREVTNDTSQPAGDDNGDSEEAWTLPLDPVSLEVCLLVHLADLMIDAKLLREAKREFMQALQRQRESPLVYLHLAHLKNLEKDEQGAIHDLEKCIELAPEGVLAHLRLAQIYAAMENGKHLDKAKEHIKLAEDRVGGRGDVLMVRGELAFIEKRREPALKFFERASRADPRNYVAYFFRAMVFIESQRNEEAKHDLEKAIELNPEYSIAILQNATLSMNQDASVTKLEQIVQEVERAALLTKADEDLDECAQLYVTLKAQVESAKQLGFDYIRES